MSAWYNERKDAEVRLSSEQTESRGRTQRLWRIFRACEGDCELHATQPSFLSGTPTLPALSYSFPAPRSTSGGLGTLRRSARPRTHAIARAEFHQDVMDVNFDRAKFNAQLTRYLFV
jgi:hypothetical protein